MPKDKLTQRVIEILETIVSKEDFYSGILEDKATQITKELKQEWKKEVEKIMRDTLSVDPLQYHNEVNEMYRKLEEL